MFRIQKLMLEEFREIYEPVIVENPFTQVTECGQGIRQYQIGLTRSKIIFGCDDFDNTDMDGFYCKELDPEIETFQLVSLMPLEFIKLNFYRKKERSIMRITICGEEEDKAMLFEFGGHLYRSLFWKTWRERISTIRLLQSKLFHISGSSPCSSTDVLNEEQICHAVVHHRNDSNYSTSNYATSCSLKSQ